MLDGFKNQVERMESILKIRPHGLYMSYAQKIYRQQFEEEFPKNVWDLMESARLVSINPGLKIVVWRNEN